ncbi:hypothetical protein [Desulfoscipio geothermicus]|uniref:hypothetical protein n=1 Tax=Desulfoscipio geothermicus TaxID=39060 RepID=UPI0013F4EDC7
MLVSRLPQTHLFQGQLRVTRISRLPASLGGLIGPCSMNIAVNPSRKISVTEILS